MLLNNVLVVSLIFLYWTNPVQEQRKVPTKKVIPWFVVKYSDQFGVDPELVHAVIQVESTKNHKARSPKGAVGLMQLMPTTAAWLKVNPFDIEDNIKGGTKYLAMQIKTFKNVKLALAAYNAGPGTIHKYGRVPPIKETQDYVSKVCNIYQGCEIDS